MSSMVKEVITLKPRVCVFESPLALCLGPCGVLL